MQKDKPSMTIMSKLPAFHSHFFTPIEADSRNLSIVAKQFLGYVARWKVIYCRIYCHFHIFKLKRGKHANFVFETFDNSVRRQ